MAAIGDPRPGVGLRPDGLPEFDWCKVEFKGRSSVKVEIEKVGKVEVTLPFRIARYPVTYIQFQAFIDAPDGFGNREIDWFEGLAADDKDKRQAEQRFKFDNHPRENLNWYQAIAFCRWLSWRLERAGRGENATLLARLAGKGWPEDEVVPPGRSRSASEAKAPTLPSFLKGKGRRAPAKVRRFDLMESVHLGRALADGSGMAVRGRRPFGQRLSLGKRLGWPFREYVGKRPESRDGSGDVSGGSCGVRRAGYEWERLGMDADGIS